AVLPTCANYATIQQAGAVTAANECGAVTVTCSPGDIVVTGCNRSLTLTFTATACGLTSTCTRTYNWQGLTAPGFTNWDHTHQLGCNPSVTTTCDNYTTIQTAGAVTAANECGAVTVTCNAGAVTSQGCNRSQVLTFTATACGLTSTCTRTYNWQVVTAPVFTNCGQTYELGCNPSVTPTCANYATIQQAGAVTAANECAAVPVTCNAGSVVVAGCNRSQILTFTATACGLTSTCTRTYNWQVVTAPVFVNANQIVSLPCNPVVNPNVENYATILGLGPVLANNECGPIAVQVTLGDLIINGSDRVRLIHFTATACGLTATATRE